ncbi:hypothetical protein PCANC_04486 [Puccinia coronata f. sp. avenae]|uniref:Uncharacterized protein n=2 Tax=Puccinia coronata f. sp. avenae TaxID=200324 RepID=A0A2N5VUT3_9BASI|nr:hypothetical protein PCANC_04486 [Puccinia coronata f. sp. avenae]
MEGMGNQLGASGHDAIVSIALRSGIRYPRLTALAKRRTPPSFITTYPAHLLPKDDRSSSTSVTVATPEHTMRLPLLLWLLCPAALASMDPSFTDPPAHDLDWDIFHVNGCKVRTRYLRPDVAGHCEWEDCPNYIHDKLYDHQCDNCKASSDTRFSRWVTCKEHRTHERTLRDTYLAQRGLSRNG